MVTNPMTKLYSHTYHYWYVVSALNSTRPVVELNWCSTSTVQDTRYYSTMHEYRTRYMVGIEDAKSSGAHDVLSALEKRRFGYLLYAKPKAY